MSAPSIPDRAAALVAMIEKANDRIGDVRRADGEWTTMKMMLDEAAGIAHAGITHAYTLAMRMHSLADEEAARLNGKKP